MKHALHFLAIVIATTAHAAETKLDNAGIQAVLEEKSLYADGVEQIFRKGGLTFYLDHGNSSQGTWTIAGGQYCSSWPPNPSSACYDVLQDGDTITFVSKDGRRFPMRMTK